MCQDVEECMEAGQETSRKEEIWHCSGCVGDNLGEGLVMTSHSVPPIRGKVKRVVKRISARPRVFRSPRGLPQIQDD
jgi:hypothetical protein